MKHRELFSVGTNDGIYTELCHWLELKHSVAPKSKGNHFRIINDISSCEELLCLLFGFHKNDSTSCEMNIETIDYLFHKCMSINFGGIFTVGVAQKVLFIYSTIRKTPNTLHSQVKLLDLEPAGRIPQRGVMY